MSTRTREELTDAVKQAWPLNDAEVLLQCAEELEALHTRETDAQAANVRGRVEQLRGNYSSALDHYHRALAVYEELGDRRGMARVTGNISLVFHATGNYPTELEHLHRSLALFEELGDRSGVAYITVSIGNVHYYSANFQVALEHFHRALALYDELGERRGVANATGNIGNVHNSTDNYQEALEYYRRSLAQMEELGMRSGMTVALGNILSALISIGDLTEAEVLLQKMDGMQIDQLQVVIQRELSRAMLQEKTGNTDGAVATTLAALGIAREHSLAMNQADLYRYLRDLALKQNDLASYVEYNNEYQRINEEIRGKEATVRLAMQAKEREIAHERLETAKQLAVLHSTLPKHIADRVARGEVVNDHYDNASVLFLDIVGFTTISDQLTSDQVVRLLGHVFTTLDTVCDKHDVVKIKTIGDSYMAVAFPHSVPRFARNDSSLPHNPGEDSVIPSEARNGARDEVQRAANAALDMLTAIADLPESLPESLPAILRETLREALPEGLRVRIGMHCGPVTAGVIGTQRMQYDVWGDTVNVASRMESTSEPGKIHVSSSFALALNSEMAKERNSETAVIPSVSEEGETAVIPSVSEEGETAVIPSVSEEQRDSSQFPVPCSLRERGALEIKGKGTMKTYWLEGA